MNDNNEKELPTDDVNENTQNFIKLEINSNENREISDDFDCEYDVDDNDEDGDWNQYFKSDQDNSYQKEAIQNPIMNSSDSYSIIFQSSKTNREKLGPKTHYKPQRTTKDKSVLGVSLC